MYEAQKYAKEAISCLKKSEISPFDVLGQLAEMNDLDICRGSFTSWEVLELMIVLDYTLQQEKTRKNTEK